MKLFKFLLALIINLALIYALSTKFGQIPSLGYFLSPATGFWQNAETVGKTFDFDLEEDILKAPVTIKYDSFLVPHLFAENDHDLYFAQGYITARHRLWQMEFQTHFAAGRISEIVGEQALQLDRESRRKGLGLAAERAVGMMEQDEKVFEMVSAYSDGVNAYINSLDASSLPLEYKLLGYKPEAWAPIKSAYLLKYMANDLSYHNADFEYTNAVKLFGRKTFDFLFPDVHPEQEPIVQKINQWDFEKVDTVQAPTKLPFASDAVNAITEVYRPDPKNGSNNWAVAGNKTQSGNPILCGDPHLGLNLPSIWFAMQLSAPGVEVKGVTLPGSPNIIIGFNKDVAWSVTNALRDVVDWYKIEYTDKSRSAYLLDGKNKPIEFRIEEIKLRGKPSFYDTVAITDWGPVMYDESFPTDSKEGAYALRWIAHDPSLEVKTFYLLNRAKSYKDYREALTYYKCPAQNFVFASNEGDIAMVIQGKFANKWPEQGKFIMDGTTKTAAWQDYIPMEHNVFELNPERGFVGSANQHPVDTTYPYYAYAHSYEYYRNRRINDLLDSLNGISLSTMEVIQNDNYNLTAAENLPYWLEQVNGQLSGQEEQKVYKLLKAWDFVNSVDAEAASYFEAWQDVLRYDLWDEFRNGQDLDWPSTFTGFKLLKQYPNNEFIDDKGTNEVEDAQALIYRAFKKGIERVNKEIEEKGLDNAAWSKYKNTSVVHLARLPAFSESNISIGGNHNIINATSERHGASWRMIVELTENGPIAKGIYPGGQSGNPGSPYYKNMIPNWAAGNYIDFGLRKVGDFE